MPKKKGLQRQRATVELKISIEISGESAEEIRKRFAAVVSTSEIEIAGERGEVVDMKGSLNLKKNRMQRLLEDKE